jgi:hypothetical protein
LLAAKAARAASGVRLRIASDSGGTSEMRNTVPLATGWSWRLPPVGSGSSAGSGIGIALVFQTS